MIKIGQKSAKIDQKHIVIIDEMVCVNKFKYLMK